jgi:hypothetical protein
MACDRAFAISCIRASAGTTGQHNADPDGDGLINNGEWLTQSNPTNALDDWGIEMLTIPNGLPTVHFEQTGRRGFEV